MLQRPTVAHLRQLLGDACQDGAGRGRWCCVVDADRTLAPMDTGRLVGARLGFNDIIRNIFATIGYKAAAFSQVAEIWGSKPNDEYLAALDHVAGTVVPHAQWLTVLAALTPTLPVVVVTAGIPHVWRSALDRIGYPRLPVIGGCHSRLDAYIVCPDTKADIVRVLQAAGWRVVAAGDSLIDLPMLRQADLGLFVPDHKGSPSLRAELSGVPHMRHFAVDQQTFDGLQPRSATDIIHHCLEQTPC